MITCNNCDAPCCKNTFIKFGQVNSIMDLESIKWFVTRKNIRAYIYKNEWGIEILDSPCQFINENNNCSIYQNRPSICREYQIENCIKNTKIDDKKIIFDNIYQVDEYIKQYMANKIKGN